MLLCIKVTPIYLDSHLWQPYLPHVGEGVKELCPWVAVEPPDEPVLYPFIKLSEHGIRLKPPCLL